MRHFGSTPTAANNPSRPVTKLRQNLKVLFTFTSQNDLFVVPGVPRTIRRGAGNDPVWIVEIAFSGLLVVVDRTADGRLVRSYEFFH